jgi:hypothetical protein
VEEEFPEVRIARTDPGVLDRGKAPWSNSSRAWVRWGRGRGEEESVNDDLRQKILDIICKEWPTPDGYLLGFDINERLRSQGVEVTHEAVNTVLSRLATSGRITLSFSAGDGPPPGGAVIHDIEDDLCE